MTTSTHPPNTKAVLCGATTGQLNGETKTQGGPATILRRACWTSVGSAEVLGGDGSGVAYALSINTSA